MVHKDRISIVVAVFLALAVGVAIGSGLPLGVRTATVTLSLTETLTKTVVETVPVAGVVRETVTIPQVVTVPQVVGRVSVVDALGREVIFEKPPERVVSLAPSITETLFALGLEGKVVGVTGFCNYPPRVIELVNEGRISIIGGYWNPDLEKILALRPDLVIGSAGTRPHVQLKDALERAGVKVIYVHGSGASNINEVRWDILTLARVFGAEAVAEALNLVIMESILRVEESVSRLLAEGRARPKVLVLLGPLAWGLYSAGGNTFIGWVISAAGGENIAGRFLGWPLLDYEYILSNDPDVIIVSAMGADYEALVSEIGATPLAKTRAYREGRVYVIDLEANDVLMRPGPRIHLAVKLMASILYPEVFGEPEIPVVYKATQPGVVKSSWSTQQVAAGFAVLNGVDRGALDALRGGCR